MAQIKADGVEKRFLILIRRLYSNTSCQLRVSASGTLAESIPINRGTKQGCILAPTVFNLNSNDLAPVSMEMNSHCPKLGTLQRPLLLYAEGMVLISRTRIGLKG